MGATLPQGVDLSIPNLVANLAYQKASQAIMYIGYFERWMKPHKVYFNHELRRKFNELMQLCARIRIMDEDYFSQDIWDGASQGEGNPAEQWDNYHHDVSIFAMLDMLIADKCGNNEENLRKIVKFVQELQGGLGKVTQENIEQLKIR